MQTFGRSRRCVLYCAEAGLCLRKDWRESPEGEKNICSVAWMSSAVGCWHVDPRKKCPRSGRPPLFAAWYEGSGCHGRVLRGAARRRRICSMGRCRLLGRPDVPRNVTVGDTGVYRGSQHHERLDSCGVRRSHSASVLRPHPQLRRARSLGRLPDCGSGQPRSWRPGATRRAWRQRGLHAGRAARDGMLSRHVHGDADRRGARALPLHADLGHHPRPERAGRRGRDLQRLAAVRRAQVADQGLRADQPNDARDRSVRGGLRAATPAERPGSPHVLASSTSSAAAAAATAQRSTAPSRTSRPMRRRTSRSAQAR